MAEIFIILNDSGGPMLLPFIGPDGKTEYKSTLIFDTREEAQTFIDDIMDDGNDVFTITSITL